MMLVSPIIEYDFMDDEGGFSIALAETDDFSCEITQYGTLEVWECTFADVGGEERWELAEEFDSWREGWEFYKSLVS